MNPTSETPQAVPPQEPLVSANPGQADANGVPNNPTLVEKLGGLLGGFMRKAPSTDQSLNSAGHEDVPSTTDLSSGLPQSSDANDFASRLDNQAPLSPAMGGEPQVVTMGSSTDTSLGTPSPIESHPDQAAVGIGGNSGPDNNVSHDSLGGNDAAAQAVEEQPHVEGLALDPTGIGVSGGEPVIEQKTEPLSPDLGSDSSDAVHIPGVEAAGGLGQDNTAAIEPQTSLENPSAVDTSPAVNSDGVQIVEPNPEVVGSLDNASKEKIREKVQAALNTIREIEDILGPEANSQTGDNVNGQIPAGVNPIAETKV